MMLADTRETRGVKFDQHHYIIPKMLERVGVKVEIVPLEVGDYVVIGPTRSACVESKDARDYISSIMSGQLNKELYQMSCNYDKNVLIIFGSIEEALAFRKLKREIYANYLAGCVVHESPRGNKGSISVFNFHSPYDAVQMMKSLHDMIAEDDIFRRPSAKRYKPKPEEEVEYTIQSWPVSCKIGPKRAKVFSKRYKSIKNFVNATKDDLMNVKGVGKKMANSIWEHSNREV